MASQLHSLPTPPGPSIGAAGQPGSTQPKPPLRAPKFSLSMLRSAENDFLAGVIVCAAAVMSMAIYFGEVTHDDWRSYEPAPSMDRPVARSVHILVATQRPKEEAPKKIEEPKPPTPPKPVVVAPTPPPEVAKVEPKPAAKPPKVKPKKQRHARKTKVKRTTAKRRPASKTPDGRVQRILSKGDKPAPDGPAPPKYADAGAGAATGEPATAPVAGDPKGTADGVGTEPKTAPAPAAPAIDLNQLRRKYVRRVGKAVRKDFKYPRAASRAGMEGKVVVAITIDAEGNIVAAKVTKSSGFNVLDNAAIAAAKSVHRVPKPPAELQWQRRRVKVPFTFRLRPS